MIANSKFFTRFGLGGSYGLVSDNSIDDQTLSGDFSWFRTSESTIKFGAQFKTLGFEYINTFQEDTTFQINTVPFELGTYIKTKYEYNSRFIYR